VSCQRNCPLPREMFHQETAAFDLNPEVFAAEKEVSDVVREVFLVQGKLYLVQGKLCLVQEKLCLVQEKLCLVQEKLCLVERKLCLVERKVCFGSESRFNTNLGSLPAVPKNGGKDLRINRLAGALIQPPSFFRCESAELRRGAKRQNFLQNQDATLALPIDHPPRDARVGPPVVGLPTLLLTRLLLRQTNHGARGRKHHADSYQNRSYKRLLCAGEAALQLPVYFFERSIMGDRQQPDRQQK
jgi:hypothetical protein